MDTMTTDSSGPRARPRRILRTGLAVAAAAILLAAGCGDDDDDTTAAGSGSGGEGGGGDMTVDIVEPGDGSEVGAEFDLEVDTSVDIGEPDTGLHHVHLYYDGNQSDGEYDIVYSVDEPWTVDRDLPPGEHTIEAFIANADHSLTDASDEITVMVGEGAGGGGTDTTGSDRGPYDY
jgi:hypothetical protein